MGHDSPAMEIASIPDAIAWQADHAREAGAPGTARVLRGLLQVLAGNTAVGRRMAGWQGLTLKDAMPLRIHAGLHHLLLSGEDRRLEPVYEGITTDQDLVDALVVGLVETYDHRLLPWLDHPPQTNEAGRSASVMAGLLWLGQRVAPRFDPFEIGASAGINTMLGRYRFDLGGVAVGPSGGRMRIAPEWRGPPPPTGPVEIAEPHGCDLRPVDLTDPEAVLRLKSYVWPEARERMARIDTAAELAARFAPEVARQDAADFVADRLALPQPEGTTRVLFHTIVWQYLPDFTRNRIETAMADAARRATGARPLAWLELETNRATFRHELRARYWPGGGEAVLLGEAHPHGAWVAWRG